MESLSDVMDELVLEWNHEISGTEIIITTDVMILDPETLDRIFVAAKNSHPTITVCSVLKAEDN